VLAGTDCETRRFKLQRIIIHHALDSATFSLYFSKKYYFILIEYGFVITATRAVIW